MGEGVESCPPEGGHQLVSTGTAHVRLNADNSSCNDDGVVAGAGGRQGTQEDSYRREETQEEDLVELSAYSYYTNTLVTLADNPRPPTSSDVAAPNSAAATLTATGAQLGQYEYLLGHPAYATPCTPNSRDHTLPLPPAANSPPANGSRGEGRWHCSLLGVLVHDSPGRTAWTDSGGFTEHSVDCCCGSSDCGTLGPQVCRSDAPTGRGDGSSPLAAAVAPRRYNCLCQNHLWDIAPPESHQEQPASVAAIPMDPRVGPSPRVLEEFSVPDIRDTPSPPVTNPVIAAVGVCIAATADLVTAAAPALEGARSLRSSSRGRRTYLSAGAGLLPPLLSLYVAALLALLPTQQVAAGESNAFPTPSCSLIRVHLYATEW